MEQELLTLPVHLSSPSGFSRVRITRSLVLCFLNVDHFFPFVLFLLDIVLSCPSITDSDYTFDIFNSCQISNFSYIPFLYLIFQSTKKSTHEGCN